MYFDVTVTDNANLAPVRVNSRTDFTDLADLPAPASPTTSADGWGEVENGLNGDHESDKDGWDDMEPLEEAKPPPALANIQAAQKRPVSLQKPQGTTIIRLKLTYNNVQLFMHSS